MNTLSNERFLRAREYMMTKARPLERAIFEYKFESGSYRTVIEELSKYQNEDGGFGHALEPDLRCAESSSLATTTALQIVSELTLDTRGIEMVNKAMDYFLHTYREELHGWDMIPEEAENSPRAIWWKYGVFREHWGNPNAEIIGYFLQFSTMVPKLMTDDLIDYAAAYLQRCDLSEFHELYCFLRLAERLDEEQLKRFKGRLDAFVENCMPKQPFNSEQYGASPIHVIPSSQTRYYEEYSDAVHAALDKTIEDQAEDGSWEPNWSWYQYEEDWKTAKEEWKGILTVKNLTTLRSFGRIQ